MVDNKEDMRNPLIRIELEDGYSVPRVWYNGIEINSKQNIEFNWETDEAEVKPVYFKIQHLMDGVSPTVIEHDFKHHRGDKS